MGKLPCFVCSGVRKTARGASRRTAWSCRDSSAGAAHCTRTPEGAGARTWIAVPCPTPVTICTSPPIMCARSSMLTSPRPPPACSYRFEIESAAIVRHDQIDVIARSGERDREVSSFAMNDAVSKRLLGNSEETHCDIRVDVV